MASQSRRRGGPDELSQASLGFFRVWTTYLGRRYGLLQDLAKAPRGMTSIALALGRGHDASAVSAWCESAHGLGLLERNGPRFRLPPSRRRLLADDTDESYLAGQFSYLALRSLDYDGFDALFRSGALPKGVPRHLVEACAEATRWDHTAFLKILLPNVPTLRADLVRGARILDVGSGSGEWDLRMATQFRRSTFLGVEPNPEALRRAQRNVAGAHLDGRVRFVRGTGEAMRFRDEFDVAYLGEVLYGTSSKARVLRNCHRALRPGGRLVIVEGLIDRRTNPRAGDHPLLYGFQLDFALQGARLLTPPEVRGLLREAGFRRPRFLHAGGGLWFVVAGK